MSGPVAAEGNIGGGTMATKGIGCWLLAFSVALACVSAQAQDEGLAEARAAAERIMTEGDAALDAAIEVIAARKGGFVGRQLIASSVSKRRLGSGFSQRLGARIGLDLVVAERQRSGKARPEEQPDWEAVDALVLTFRELWTQETTDVMFDLALLPYLIRVCGQGGRFESALPAVRVACEAPQPMQRMRAALDAVKMSDFLREAPEQAAEARRLGVRVLVALADTCERDRDPYGLWGTFYAALEWPTLDWSARLEGMAAAREHWPERAASFDQWVLEHLMSDEDLPAIADAVLRNPRALPEAMRLLDATKKTTEAATFIREQLQREDIPGKTRVWGELALRALREDGPE
jgi:hypothetical protein